MPVSLPILIEMLEASSEPDRVHDIMIRDTLDLPAMLVPPDGGDEAYPYTSSFDAAMRLVPQDCRVTLEGSVDNWHSSVTSTKWNDDHAGMGSHQSPIIALCLAALRARILRRG